ncbi:MAG: LemA family protein [Acidobacteriota bacterium]
MKTGWIVIGVVVLAALVLGSSLMGSRNELVTERENYKAAFQQVDVDLQRRLDLIPNLVATVKGFAAQEKEIMESIANARSAMMGAKTPAERIAGNSQLDSALSRLLVVVENYPQLKSNENFLRLQDDLSGTENRIAISRRRYNEAVQRYNIDIELFPKNIAASLFGFKHEDAYFSADAAAKQAPKVVF